MLLGHSFGGLIIQYYIASLKNDQLLGNLLLLFVYICVNVNKSRRIMQCERVCVCVYRYKYLYMKNCIMNWNWFQSALLYSFKTGLKLKLLILKQNKKSHLVIKHELNFIMACGHAIIVSHTPTHTHTDIWYIYIYMRSKNRIFMFFLV